MGAFPRHKFSLMVSSFAICMCFAHLSASDAVTLQIRDDQTGGDCASFASWDSKTKTCSLTADLAGSVEILSNGVALAGNGHAIRGAPSEGRYVPGGGVILSGVTGVTVTHVLVENFEAGIQLNGVTSAMVMHNTLRNNYAGIWLDSSSQNHIVANDTCLCLYGIVLYLSGYNTILGNIEEGNSYAGIYLYGSDYNSLVGNDLGLTEKTGIRLNNSHSNTVTGNRIESVQIGLFINPYSENNIVVHNNFVDNDVQLSYQPSVEGVGNTIAGNYWNDYDSETEGCDDADGDDICRDPYELLDDDTVVAEDRSASVTNTAAAAAVQISPNVLTVSSRGNAITAYIKVPGHAAGGITVESLRLVTEEGYVWANETAAAVGDHDSDGVPDLMVKFDRQLVMKILNPGLNEGVVTGALADSSFQGRVFITLK